MISVQFTKELGPTAIWIYKTWDGLETLVVLYDFV
jgi:hypothetical protein